MCVCVLREEGAGGGGGGGAVTGIINDCLV